MSVPAVQAGLDLDQRVVRRHVAKLEAAGWLARAPWVLGEGSVAWLTAAGIQGAGLGGVRAVKSPPAPTTIAHGVLVGWSAARAEHRGPVWKSARELALDRERWAVPMRCERGSTEQLPDLAVWLEPSQAPGAVIAESGGRREDRQRMILEGWRDAIWSGRYIGVRYDRASPSVAHWITRLAKKVGLTGSAFAAVMQTTAEQIIAPPTAPEPTVDKPKPTPDTGRRGSPADPRRTRFAGVRTRTVTIERAPVSTDAAARASRSCRAARAAHPRTPRRRRREAPAPVASTLSGPSVPDEPRACWSRRLTPRGIPT